MRSVRATVPLPTGVACAAINPAIRSATSGSAAVGRARNFSSRAFLASAAVLSRSLKPGFLKLMGLRFVKRDRS